jgi:hypothetical protein
MKETIYRDDALDILSDEGWLGDSLRRISALPAAQPEAHVNKTPKSKHDAVKLPVGMIMGFIHNPGPDWCLMDGRHLPAEQYPELAAVMTSWCRDGVIMVPDLSAYNVLPGRHYLRVRSWPDGLFHLTGDTLGLRCATTGCGQHVSTRFESDGVGSDYCEPCGRKAAEPKDKSNAL